MHTFQQIYSTSVLKHRLQSTLIKEGILWRRCVLSENYQFSLEDGCSGLEYPGGCVVVSVDRIKSLTRSQYSNFATEIKLELLFTP